MADVTVNEEGGEITIKLMRHTAAPEDFTFPGGAKLADLSEKLLEMGEQLTDIAYIVNGKRVEDADQPLQPGDTVVASGRVKGG